MVFVSICGRNFAVPARGLLRSAAWRGFRLCESELAKIHAKMIFGRGANPGFRVDRAAQMVVEVTALRHLEQKLTKLQRILPRGV